MRRDSEPTNPKSKDVKPKLITAAHVTPVAAATSPQSVEKSDKVAYERNVEGLKQELQRSHPRNDAIKTLTLNCWRSFHFSRSRIGYASLCTS